MKRNTSTKQLVALALAVVTIAVSVTFVAPKATAQDRDGTKDFVERLYVSLLDRKPEASGHQYWTDQLDSGTLPFEMLEHFLATPEGQAKKPDIADVYERILFREPDAPGLKYWQGVDYNEAVIWISMSREALGKWDHKLYTQKHPKGAPDYFVHTGNGVFVPPVLLRIRWCESKGDYTAQNSRSTASGAYQFVVGTAVETARKAGRFDLTTVTDKENHAGSWHPADQDRMALALWERNGTRDWDASRHCWG